jgi:hypothetical protein
MNGEEKKSEKSNQEDMEYGLQRKSSNQKTSCIVLSSPCIAVLDILDNTPGIGDTHITNDMT